MKKHLSKSNRKQFKKTSNLTGNSPKSLSAKDRPDRAPSRASAALGSSEPERKHPTRSDQPPPPKRMALVENDPDNILVIEKIFQSAAADWRLEIHSSTGEALHEITARPPSLVLLATALPGLPLPECVHRFKVLLPTMPVVILSANLDASDMIRCLAAGASGHLVKSTRADEFLSALDHALQGEIVVCPRSLAALANHLPTNADRPRTRRLTPREEEVLGYVAKGLLNKEIADKLGISVATVRSHLVTILGQLGVHDRRTACRIYQAL